MVTDPPDHPDVMSVDTSAAQALRVGLARLGADVERVVGDLDVLTDRLDTELGTDTAAAVFRDVALTMIVDMRGRVAAVGVELADRADRIAAGTRRVVEDDEQNAQAMRRSMPGPW